MFLETRSPGIFLFKVSLCAFMKSLFLTASPTSRLLSGIVWLDAPTISYCQFWWSSSSRSEAGVGLPTTKRPPSRLKNTLTFVHQNMLLPHYLLKIVICQVPWKFSLSLKSICDCCVTKPRIECHQEVIVFCLYLNATVANSLRMDRRMFHSAWTVTTVYHHNLP